MLFPAFDGKVGILKPLVNYTSISRIRAGADRDGKATYRMLGVGTQVSYAKVDVDLEYDHFLRPAFTSHTWDATGTAKAVSNFKSQMDTYVGQVAYKLPGGLFRPFVKASMDTTKQDGVKTLPSRRDAYGVEYRPGGAASGFPYHAVGIDKRDDNLKNGAMERTNTRQYLVGLAAKI